MPQSPIGGRTVEPVNHWQPVTTEYQLELAPRLETRPARRKRSRRPGNLHHAARAGLETETSFALTAISCYYFLRACAYFFCGSVLLCYPSSEQAGWLLEHARLLLPVSVSTTPYAPQANLLAEGLFIMAAIAAAVGVLWVVECWGTRGITMLYAAASVACTVIYFRATMTVDERVLLTVHQQEALLADAMINLLIFAYLAFCPTPQRELESAHS